MDKAKQLALWADRLRDISAMGLHFAENRYDADNYRSIQEIAMSLMAMANGETMADMEPLRTPVFSRPTPISVGDGAVINDAGQILLIKRADNGKWAMPGGALEVGETPGEGVVREVLEETGIETEAIEFIGVHDSRLCQSTSRHHLYHFLFLCRPLNNGIAKTPSHAGEVLEVGWFKETELPEDISPGHVSRIPEGFRMWRGDCRAYFDLPTSSD